MEPRVPACHPRGGGARAGRLEVRIEPLAGLHDLQAYAGGSELRRGPVRRPRAGLPWRARLLFAPRQGRRRLGLRALASIGRGNQS